MKPDIGIINAEESPNKILVLFSFFLFVIAVGYGFRFLPTEFDDSYMYLRYVKNFHNGHGHSWNISDGPVYGCSSILYFIFLLIWSALLPFGDSIVLASASIFAGLFSIVIILKSIFNHSNSQVILSNKPLVGLVLCFLITGRIYLYNCFTGSDTTLSLLTNCLLVYSGLHYIKKSNSTHLFFLVFTAYLTYLCRPDNFIYSVIFPIGLILIDGVTDRLKHFTYFSIGLFGMLILDVGMKQAFFNDFFPLSFYVKQTHFYQQTSFTSNWSSLKHLFQFINATLPFFLVISLTNIKGMRRFVYSCLLPFAATIAYYFSVVQIMGGEARLYLPSLPFVVIPSVLLLDRFLGKASFPNTKTLKIANKNILITVAFFVIIGHNQTVISLYNRVVYKYERIKLSGSDTKSTEIFELNWIDGVLATTQLIEQLPEGTTVAMTEVGMAGAKAMELEIVDMTGLHDYHLAHYGFDVQYLLSRNPDLIFMNSAYKKMNTDLLKNGTIQSEFDFYPMAFFGGLLVSRENESYNEVFKILKLEWQKIYPFKRIEDCRSSGYLLLK